MIKQYQILKKIQNTSSNNEKQEILEKNKDDELLKRILEFVYNPYFRTGLSSKKIDKEIAPTEYRLLLNTDDSILYMFNYLKDHNTGTDNDIAHVQWYIRNYSEGCSDLVKEILTQNLKIGMTAKSINKVFTNLIPEFDVMLAEKYWEKIGNLEQEKPEILITQKLDGIRCVALKNGNNIELMSRSGQLMTGFVEIENELRTLPDGVYDGEMLADFSIENSLDLFSSTIMTARTKSDNKVNMAYNVFDYIENVGDFVNNTLSKNCRDRKKELENILKTIKCKHIKYVPVLYDGVYDGKIVDKMLNTVLELKGEGVMVNLVNAPYQKKRTSDILKVKKMYSMDLLVTDIFEGKGKYKGTLGGVFVDFKGNKVGVGSGFNDMQRKMYWENPVSILGKLVEVQYFEVSKDNKTGLESLRFPIFKGIREDKNEISFD